MIDSLLQERQQTLAAHKDSPLYRLLELPPVTEVELSTDKRVFSVPPGLESLVLVLDTTKPIDHLIPIGKRYRKIDQKYFEKTDFTLGTFPIHVLERLLLPHTKDRQSARPTEGTVFYSLI